MNETRQYKAETEREMFEASIREMCETLRTMNPKRRSRRAVFFPLSKDIKRVYGCGCTQSLIFGEVLALFISSQSSGDKQVLRCTGCFQPVNVLPELVKTATELNRQVPIRQVA